MTKIDVDGCSAILWADRVAKTKRLERNMDRASTELAEVRAQPLEPTAGMKFMQLLDSMADEIRETVLSAWNEVVLLLDYFCEDGDAHTPDYKRLTIHPLFTKLGIACECKKGIGRPFMMRTPFSRHF